MPIGKLYLLCSCWLHLPESVACLLGLAFTEWLVSAGERDGSCLVNVFGSWSGGSSQLRQSAGLWDVYGYPDPGLSVTGCQQELRCDFNQRLKVLENYLVSERLLAKTRLWFKWGELNWRDDLTCQLCLTCTSNGSRVLLQGCLETLNSWQGSAGWVPWPHR